MGRLINNLLVKKFLEFYNNFAYVERVLILDLMVSFLAFVLNFLLHWVFFETFNALSFVLLTIVYVLIMASMFFYTQSHLELWHKNLLPLKAIKSCFYAVGVFVPFAIILGFYNLMFIINLFIANLLFLVLPRVFYRTQPNIDNNSQQVVLCVGYAADLPNLIDYANKYYKVGFAVTENLLAVGQCVGDVKIIASVHDIYKVVKYTKIYTILIYRHSYELIQEQVLNFTLNNPDLPKLDVLLLDYFVEHGIKKINSRPNYQKLLQRDGINILSSCNLKPIKSKKIAILLNHHYLVHNLIDRALAVGATHITVFLTNNTKDLQETLNKIYPKLNVILEQWDFKDMDMLDLSLRHVKPQILIVGADLYDYKNVGYDNLLKVIGESILPLKSLVEVIKKYKIIEMCIFIIEDLRFRNNLHFQIAFLLEQLVASFDNYNAQRFVCVRVPEVIDTSCSLVNVVQESINQNLPIKIGDPYSINLWVYAQEVSDMILLSMCLLLEKTTSNVFFLQNINFTKIIDLVTNMLEYNLYEHSFNVEIGNLNFPYKYTTKVFSQGHTLIKTSSKYVAGIGLEGLNTKELNQVFNYLGQVKNMEEFNSVMSILVNGGKNEITIQA